MRWLAIGVPSAGVFVGAVAWSANTQLGYALVPWACARGSGLTITLLSLVLVAIASLGGWLSWRALSIGEQSTPSSARFLSSVGVLVSALFVLVIILQGAAGLIFTGCEQ
jgi:hypothetical protein